MDTALRPIVPEEQNGETPVKLGLRVHVTRHEPDVDGAFLANRANSTLGTATARAETDLHVFGASASEHVLATTTPTEVTVAMDLSLIHI